MIRSTLSNWKIGQQSAFKDLETDSPTGKSDHMTPYLFRVLYYVSPNGSLWICSNFHCWRMKFL